MRKLISRIVLLVILLVAGYFGVDKGIKKAEQTVQPREQIDEPSDKNSTSTDKNSVSSDQNSASSDNSSESSEVDALVSNTTNVMPAELLPAKPSVWKSKVKDVVRHKAYTMLYNTEYNTPTWVAWRLTAAHTKGNLSRSQKFFADPSIPRQYRVDFFDYRREWDRGHMCPAGDNKWDETAMYECFYMSNMCPQDHELNSGAWGKLEIACRYWAKAEGAVYIVCGPVYKGTRHLTIGQSHKVQVPEAFFKAVVSLKKGHEKAIGFYFKNDDSKQNYRKQFMTVDELEQRIGLDLFANLADDVENRIEAKAHINDWRYVE